MALGRFLTFPEAQKFIANIEPNEHGCWIWLGGKTHDGYGQTTIATRRFMAHRVIYESLHGPVTKTLDHLCKNRACVNPKHLEDVSMHENILRGNGWAARNAQKTHCKNGHLLVERKTGGNQERFCRECYRKYDREWKQRRRDAQK